MLDHVGAECLRRAEAGDIAARRDLEIVPIRATAPLTFGAIVFELHRVAHHHLRDQDHHFYEGLKRLPESFVPGVPL